jgi:hypothetical protein
MFDIRLKMDQYQQFLKKYQTYDNYPDSLVHDRHPKKSQQYKHEFARRVLGRFRTTPDTDGGVSYILVPIRDYGDEGGKNASRHKFWDASQVNTHLQSLYEITEAMNPLSGT